MDNQSQMYICIISKFLNYSLQSSISQLLIVYYRKNQDNRHSIVNYLTMIFATTNYIYNFLRSSSHNESSSWHRLHRRVHVTCYPAESAKNSSFPFERWNSPERISIYSSIWSRIHPRVTLIRAKRHGPEAEATPAIHSGLDIRGFQSSSVYIESGRRDDSSSLSLSLSFRKR